MERCRSISREECRQDRRDRHLVNLLPAVYDGVSSSVEMHTKHGEKIVCISFNVDYVGIKSKPAATYAKKVEEFLQKHKATCTNILSAMPSDEVFQSLELSSIPAVCVYGTDGKLLKRFDDSLLVDGKDEAFTYKEDINPYVEKLLQEVK